MSFGIKPKGVFLNDKLENTKALKGFDMSGIEILGETWGEIDAEKAAALRPDLDRHDVLAGGEDVRRPGGRGQGGGRRRSASSRPSSARPPASPCSR